VASNEQLHPILLTKGGLRRWHVAREDYCEGCGSAIGIFMLLNPDGYKLLSSHVLLTLFVVRSSVFRFIT
jgi:hypothetical protein